MENTKGMVMGSIDTIVEGISFNLYLGKEHITGFANHELTEVKFEMLDTPIYFSKAVTQTILNELGAALSIDEEEDEVEGYEGLGNVPYNYPTDYNR